MSKVASGSPNPGTPQAVNGAPVARDDADTAGEDAVKAVGPLRATEQGKHHA